MLSIHLAVGSQALELTSQNFFEPQFMYITIKLLIIFVQRVVCEMDKWVIVALSMVILLGRQTHQAIIVQIDGHRTYNRSYQYIYPEVVFVTLVKSRPLDVLLNNILVLWFFNLSGH